MTGESEAWAKATSDRIVEMLLSVPDERKTTDPLYLPASLFAIVLRYASKATLDEIASIVRQSYDATRIPAP